MCRDPVPAAAALLLLLVAGQGAYGLSENCTCAQFCNHTCGPTNAGRPRSLLMYRLTLANVSTLAEKNTGDAGGDLGFFLLKLPGLYSCKPSEYNTYPCFLANRPVIRQFHVDVDGKFGPYMRCNPEQFPGNADMKHVDTRTWGCFPWHGYPPKPWVPSNRSSCQDQSYCPGLMNRTVGRDPAMHHPYDPMKPNIGAYFGGSWYNTNAQGECPDGRSPGDGLSPPCSWKLHAGSAPRAVNATCMAGRLEAPLIANGKVCFDSCPQPLDKASSCFMKCLKISVTGSKGGEPVKPISPAMMIDVWNQAFEAEANGGCPNVPPL